MFCNNPNKRHEALMNELKKNLNNIEFWCTMNKEKPHLYHTHLQIVIDTDKSGALLFLWETGTGC